MCDILLFLGGFFDSEFFHFFLHFLLYFTIFFIEKLYNFINYSMLRPGWFPEYSPSEQKIFDIILNSIGHIFTQRNFDHIWTPAVEKNDILLKGGETVANEIFGLVGLKDFEKWELERAKKDYSLHFDLTVPFARYVLDHTNEITFPFRRYQMQPVRRGERQQRGRFKEFWQCDVDCIWRSGTDVGHRYACETISTLQSALQSVLQSFSLSKKFTSHISHIGLTKSFLESHLESSQVPWVMDLFDKYYKKTHEVFMQELTALVWSEFAKTIEQIIINKDHAILCNYDEKAYEKLNNTIKDLQLLWSNVVFDITIVRWLGYYTDIVFETFFDDEIALWSICSGGWYEDFTKFIDPKQIFSGIGWSIWLSRLMEIIKDNKQVISRDSESYFFLNFENTQNDILWLYQRFISEWKTCELYPVEAKFGKQLEYADKKWITHAVILWDGEKEENIYIIKNMKTGEQVKVNL